MLKPKKSQKYAAPKGEQIYCVKCGHDMFVARDREGDLTKVDLKCAQCSHPLAAIPGVR